MWTRSFSGEEEKDEKAIGSRVVAGALRHLAYCLWKHKYDRREPDEHEPDEYGSDEHGPDEYDSHEYEPDGYDPDKHKPGESGEGADCALGFPHHVIDHDVYRRSPLPICGHERRENRA